MTNPTIDLDIRGLLDVQANLQLLALPVAKRRRLLNNAAKRLRTVNRKRLRDQRNLDGSGFEARKGAGKGKLLKGLGKGLQVVSLNANEVALGWKNSLVSRIAGEHQAGLSQTMTSARMRRIGKPIDYDAPASRQQGRALLKAGYQIRQGKRLKRPSLGWITENLTCGRAGLMLSELLGEPKKQSWKIELPARTALGANAQDVRSILNTVLQQTLNAPR